MSRAVVNIEAALCCEFKRLTDGDTMVVHGSVFWIGHSYICQILLTEEGKEDRQHEKGLQRELLTFVDVLATNMLLTRCVVSPHGSAFAVVCRAYSMADHRRATQAAKSALQWVHACTV